MNYPIGKTPAIDDIIAKALVIPVLSTEIHPLEFLYAIQEAIEQLLDKNLSKDMRSEVCKYYESFSEAQLKAALRIVINRIAYAKAMDEYLQVLYRESVGVDSKLTPHSQPESTPRFNFDEIDYHLKFYLLQGSEDDISHEGQPASKKKSSNTISKSLESANVACFLIADTFATGNTYRKKNNELNVDSISKAVMNHARSKYKDIDGQSDSSVRDKIKAGLEDVSIYKL